MPALEKTTDNLPADAVLENLARVVTCAPAGAPGPLLGRRMDDVAPLAGDLAIAVRGGRIRWLGERSRLPAEFQSLPRFDARKHLLTPGLIDCHTHPAFVRARADEFQLRLHGATYEEIAAKGGGILSSTRAVREADDQTLMAAAARNLRRLRSHGVVIAEGKSGYGLSLADELRQLRAIREAGEQENLHTIRTCLAAHSLPAEFRGVQKGREAYLRLVCEEILPAAARDGLASRADVFCEEGVFSVAESRQVGQAAKAAGLALTVHADQLHASGGGRLAAELGADSADHLEYADRQTMQAMAKASTCAVLLPGSTHFLRMDRWADARAMIEEGVCVALATDFNPGSSPLCAPAFVMHLAVMQLGMTPAEALAAFTVNAAQALHLPPAEWGCLREGARAAFCLWDVDHENEIPYYVGGNLCTEVWTCDGWRS